jgi:hypothetical protein
VPLRSAHCSAPRPALLQARNHLTERDGDVCVREIGISSSACGRRKPTVGSTRGRSCLRLRIRCLHHQTAPPRPDPARVERTRELRGRSPDPRHAGRHLLLRSQSPEAPTESTCHRAVHPRSDPARAEWGRRRRSDAGERRSGSAGLRHRASGGGGEGGRGRGRR